MCVCVRVGELLQREKEREREREREKKKKAWVCVAEEGGCES